MKQLKVINADIKCLICERAVNRVRAEAEDWTHVTFVDHTGMPVSKNNHVCQHCIEEWEPDLYEGDRR